MTTLTAQTAVRRRERLAFLAGVLTHFLWGWSFLFARIAQRSASPIVVLMWRFLAAFLFMNLLLLTGRFPLHLTRKKLAPLLLLGSVQPGIYFPFEQYGIAMTSSSFSGLMIALIPIATLAAAVPLLHEHPTGKQVLFSLLSVSGVLLLTLSGGGMGATPAGFLVLLVAVLAGSGFFILSRRLSAEASAFERTYVMVGMGAAVFTAAALLRNRADLAAVTAPLTEPGFLLSLLYLSLFASVACYFLLNHALSVLPATRIVPLENLTTVISVFAGVVILHEEMSLFSLLASLVILTGIWGVQKFRPPERE